MYILSTCYLFFFHSKFVARILLDFFNEILYFILIVWFGFVHDSLLFFQTFRSNASVDLRHFAFYAFAGRTGLIRWTRKNEVIIFSCSIMWILFARSFYYSLIKIFHELSQSLISFFLACRMSRWNLLMHHSWFHSITISLMHMLWIVVTLERYDYKILFSNYFLVAAIKNLWCAS